MNTISLESRKNYELTIERKAIQLRACISIQKDKLRETAEMQQKFSDAREEARQEVESEEEYIEKEMETYLRVQGENKLYRDVLEKNREKPNSADKTSEIIGIYNMYIILKICFF